MATAGSAEHPGDPASPAADASRSGSGPGGQFRSGSSPPENDAQTCAACAELQPGGSPACGHPACPLGPARRHSGSEERLRRRSEPERSGGRAGRRDRKEVFVCPALIPKSAEVLSGPMGKHKGVLSDSENEEPISRRIRNISAFIRKTKNSSAFSSGCQRSRSCTDPMEDRGGKLKVVVQPAAAMERVGISHSSAAGILLSSENSRSISAPITAPDRRLTWRAVLTSSTPLGLAPTRPERSISPESNDSISEELNHFKPIVCSPCTPPKRLPDGRLLEPAIVKSTPRNLTRGLQKATSYEASPAVLQKWRQIELDRQNLKVNSKATLTSPVCERTNGGGDPWRAADGAASNKRRLLFEPPAVDSVKIRVPAIRYGSGAAPRGRSDSEAAGGTPESCSGAAPLSRKASFSPFSKNSGFQRKLVPNEPQSGGAHNQSTSRRGTKRNQKTKHLDPEPKRVRPGSRAAQDRRLGQIQQDRALALKLQRQFDLESRGAGRRPSPDQYFLRSWRSTQNRRSTQNHRRRGLRRSRRINKKH
ncbi:E3 ubiquitin-protein ligase RNF169 isoform X2 [Odontesthes bonariensis]|uniref:E3 ubiquitin-protein ligase RNF169 isoform X2 n=1 Tax=Odontesthes bonariensis TaxID=219752 RepID=UPI003F588024